MPRIASAQYPPSYLENWDAYVSKISHWVQTAAKDKAALLLFPEYASLELLSLFSENLKAPCHKQFEQLNTLLEDYLGLYTTLAKQFAVTIIPGSFPVVEKTADSTIYKNRAFVISPDGVIRHQDKLMMTRFESEDWIINAGQQINIIDSTLGKLGIAICYDSEFPVLVRQLIEQGAEIILVPSCTDTVAGYHRVKISCQARALENQCLVVQASLVGDAPWCEAIDINYGAAGFFVPPDRGMPDDGILKLGEPNKPEWIMCDVDTQAILSVQTNGQVFNKKDWSLSISNNYLFKKL